jgi:predicted site-specific integrase-resolvase
LTGKKKVSKGTIQALANEVTLEEPITSIEQLESTVSKPVASVVTKDGSAFDTHYQKLLKTANEFYQNKDKRYLAELQDIINKFEGLLS